MELSLVIPFYNEVDSLEPLVSWIDKVVSSMSINYEIVMVDDGSTDKSWNKLKSIKQKYPVVKGIKFRKNNGKSAALQTAFESVEGDVVITMDADLQDSPDEIPELYRMIKEEGLPYLLNFTIGRHAN